MSITLDQVTRRYQGVPVVNDVSLEIGDGEFFVLLGPSGSGKSTLLRAIAGLTGIDHGRIALHGREVTHVSPRERGVGLVFQNYALFRHMNVAENIEFALRVRRVRASERRRRREELLRLVALEGMDERMPAQLSGGQQQRVAVARALAHKPDVLLLDEPFGALDAKIREELRRTIRQIQRELGISTVLVTHDQEEAFALADRIGVMNLGRLLEVGRPDDLYARPATRFVATFLGAANLLLALRTADGIRFGDGCVAARSAERVRDSREQEVVAVLRPEDVELASSRQLLRATCVAHGKVEEVIFSGALERIRIRLESGQAAAQTVRSDDSGAAFLEVTRTQHEQRTLPVGRGQRVAVGVRRLHVLPTPLSSFTACAATEDLARELIRHPFLAELTTRMRTRVAMRVESPRDDLERPCSGSTPGLAGTAVTGWQPDVAKQVAWLLSRGAEQVLIIPETAGSPQRVLIHWIGESARMATLAVAASLLRHVSAEAVYLGILPNSTPQAQRPAAVRTLLDARSEAQAVHGLEMRTELRFGDAAPELVRELSKAHGQMLILGVTDIGALTARMLTVMHTAHGQPMLIVRGIPAGAAVERLKLRHA